MSETEFHSEVPSDLEDLRVTVDASGSAYGRYSSADYGPVVEIVRTRLDLKTYRTKTVTERWVVSEVMTSPGLARAIFFGVRLTKAGKADRRFVSPRGGMATKPLPYIGSTGQASVVGFQTGNWGRA